MITFLLFVALLLILDVAAWFWGADSTDKVDSAEWDKRKLYDGRIW